MIGQDPTLRYLESAVRSGPIEHALACPFCGSDVRLRRDIEPELVLQEGDRLYRCVECLSEFWSLGELECLP